MWEFILGAALAAGLYALHRSAVEVECGKLIREHKKRMDSLLRDYNDLQMRCEMLIEDKHKHDLEKAYQDGYASGRDDPKRDVEMLADTLTRTGHGVVKFSRKS